MKKKIFSVRSSPDPAKIGFSPDPCSSPGPDKGEGGGSNASGRNFWRKEGIASGLSLMNVKLHLGFRFGGGTAVFGGGGRHFRLSRGGTSPCRGPADLWFICFMKQNKIYEFILADQDWIGLMIFKNFADQDWIGFSFIGSGLDLD